MRIGLVQQANTADIQGNIERLKANIRRAASEGAELVVLQELHNGLYFCQTEDTRLFDLAEPIPGPSTETFGELARELGIVLVLSLFERRAPIVRCTFLMIPLIMRSSTSRRAIWDLSRSILPSDGLASWFAGINGIRKPLA